MDITSIIDKNSPENYVKEFMECINIGKYKDAVRYYYLFCLRTKQDLQCNTYKSNEAVLNIKELYFGPALRSHSDEVSKILTREYFLEVAQEVKSNTENDKLEDPTWINKYGMSAFFGISNARQNFIPEDKWKEVRLNSINESILQLS